MKIKHKIVLFVKPFIIEMGFADIYGRETGLISNF
jgi:hypothetical protein